MKYKVIALSLLSHDSPARNKLRNLDLILIFYIENTPRKSDITLIFYIENTLMKSDITPIFYIENTKTISVLNIVVEHKMGIRER